MSNESPKPDRRRLIWVSALPFATTLDIATWLETSRQLVRSGWEVTLVGMGDRKTHVDQGVTVEAFSAPNVYFLHQFFFHWAVLRLILSRWSETDVILCHQTSALWLFPLRFWRLLRPGTTPRFIMDTRDIFDPIPSSLKVKIRQFYYRLIYALAPHMIDGQTAITPRLAELVGIPDHDLLGCWPSGVERGVFAGAAATRIWPAENDPIRLVYVGILLPGRHPLEMCQAVVEANRRGMRFEFILYGMGDERERLQAYAAEHPAAIRLMDPISHTEVPNALAAAHVGVTSLPPIDDVKYGASSPIKLFEYMAAGMPMLATRNPCHADVVGPADFAFWADAPTVDSLVAALSALWRRRDDLPALGIQASQAASEWTWEAAAGKLSAALSAGLARSSIQASQATNIEIKATPADRSHG